MIKYALAIIILSLAMTLAKRYVSRLREDALLTREILDLVIFLDERMALSLAPIPILLEDYKSQHLTECGFLPAVLRGEDMGCAFFTYVKTDGLGDGATQLVGTLFKRLGSGAIGIESERIKSARCELEKISRERDESLKKESSVTYTLTLSAALAIIILLL